MPFEFIAYEPVTRGFRLLGEATLVRGSRSTDGEPHPSPRDSPIVSTPKQVHLGTAAASSSTPLVVSPCSLSESAPVGLSAVMDPGERSWSDCGDNRAAALDAVIHAMYDQPLTGPARPIDEEEESVRPMPTTVRALGAISRRPVALSEAAVGGDPGTEAVARSDTDRLRPLSAALSLIISATSAPESVRMAGLREWEAFKIMGEQTINGEVYYQVAWEPTWEPASELEHMARLISQWKKQKASAIPRHEM